MSNEDKIILDLCGGTGAWSKPYKDYGYDVRLVTLPDQDVRTYQPPENVYGILAAPPCTEFSLACTQLWLLKDMDGRTINAMGVIIACLRIIASCRPMFWALENPVGKLRRWMGKPALIFQPFEYGDPWSKKTLLWGQFNPPKKNPVELEYVHPTGSPSKTQILTERKHMVEVSPLMDRATLRAITPAGFARAFYEANQ